MMGFHVTLLGEYHFVIHITKFMFTGIITYLDVLVLIMALDKGEYCHLIYSHDIFVMFCVVLFIVMLAVILVVA